MVKEIPVDTYWDDMCDWIREGKSLKSWCRKKNTPSNTTVMRALARVDQSYRDRYARARTDSGDASHDAILEIAQDVLAGDVDPSAGRTAADLLKWSAGKMRPEKYSERLMHVGDADNPIQHTGEVRLSFVKPNAGD